MLIMLPLIALDLFGSSVAHVGDIDGDGVGDFVAADCSVVEGVRDRSAGALFSGRDGTLIAEIAPGSVAGYFGSALLSGINLVGDERGDFAIIDAGVASPKRGVSIIVFDGGAGKVVSEISVKGGKAGKDARLIGAADYNGDGAEDFAVYCAVIPEVSAVGFAQIIVSGVDGSLLGCWRFDNLLDLRPASPSSKALALTGNWDRADAGFALRSVPDGAPIAALEGVRAHQAQVKFVDDYTGDGNGEILAFWREETEGGCILHAALFSAVDGKKVFEKTEQVKGEWHHYGCEAVGDIDGDSIADLGLVFWQRWATCSRLKVYSVPKGEQLVQICQPEESVPPIFGLDFSGLGDVDGDGFGDIVVGSCAPRNERQVPGRCEVFSGRTGSLLYAVSAAAVRPAASKEGAGERGSDSAGGEK